MVEITLNGDSCLLITKHTNSAMNACKFQIPKQCFSLEFIALTSCNSGCLQRKSVNDTTFWDMVGNGTY